MSDTTTLRQRVKRPVGRPKMIKPPPQPIQRSGIITEPVVTSHVLELVYDEPMNIKKIFNLFKLVDMRDIRMEFKLTGVRISGSGHLKHNFIELDIDSNKMTQYYCRHNIIMIIDQRNLEKIVQKIDKSYNSILFIAKQDSYMKELNIVLHDQKQGIKEYHTISLLESSSSADDNIVSSLTYLEYPLSFTLPSRYFKKVISDISKFSQDFTIERRPGAPLSFPYDSNSKTIEVLHTFTNPDMFLVRSTLDENDFLSTTVRIEYIQSLANALLSTHVQVYVDRENMTIFKTTLDDSAFTLILAVRIVSYK
jgi:hypothetical protein